MGADLIMIIRFTQIDVEDMKVSSNDKIRVASIFHSISAIASKISPCVNTRLGYVAVHLFHFHPSGSFLS